MGEWWQKKNQGSLSHWYCRSVPFLNPPPPIPSATLNHGLWLAEGILDLSPWINDSTNAPQASSSPSCAPLAEQINTPYNALRFTFYNLHPHHSMDEELMVTVTLSIHFNQSFLTRFVWSPQMWTCQYLKNYLPCVFYYLYPFSLYSSHLLAPLALEPWVDEWNMYRRYLTSISYQHVAPTTTTCPLLLDYHNKPWLVWLWTPCLCTYHSFG